MRSLIVLLGLLALASAQANVFFNYDGIGDLEYRPFTDTTPLNLYVSLRSYLCTASSCADKTCSHLYCATDANGKCTSGDMVWTASLGNVAFTYACCVDANNCGVPANTGGFVTLTPTKIGGGTLSFTGKNKECGAVASNQWDFVAPINVAAIKTFCTGNGGAGKYTGWTPVFARPPANSQQYVSAAGNGFAQVNVITSNNGVDPVFFNASVAVAASTPSVPPTDISAGAYFNGPSAGTFQSPDCGKTAVIQPPTVCGAYSGCSGSCGCAYMTMLNRTIDYNGCGPGCPTTTFLFQMCLLCNFGFSYLALCGQNQGTTAVVGLGGNGGSVTSGTYTGVQGCTYQLASGGQTAIQGCQVIKYAKGSCSWAQGNCDIFPVTLAGNVNDYTFTFSVHAGQGSDVQVINIKAGSCPTGSCPGGATFDLKGVNSCPCPTPTPPTTPPPPTTPAPTTPAPPTTPPPPTTIAVVSGTTAPPSTATTPPTPAPTTPAPTTPAPTTPEPTTPGGCPGDGICGKNCDECCYTNAASMYQGYCVPSANGQWVLTLIPKNTAPPSGALRPNGTTPAGCPLDCECNIQTKPCDCTVDPTKCVCDQCTGTCNVDPVCNIVINTPPANSTCPPCPIGAGTNTECNSKGVCNCGVCICANVSNAGGPACDQPTNGGQYTDCQSCVSASFTWCELAGVGACMPASECTTFGGIPSDCSIAPVGCENNCTCPPNDAVRGTCVTQDGLSQCICQKKWHGADCCTPGGLSRGAIAGIAAGAIAGIVVAGLVVFVIIGYAAKKGVDWVALRNQNMAAAHDNPMFKARTTEHVNPLADSANA